MLPSELVYARFPVLLRQPRSKTKSRIHSRPRRTVWHNCQPRLLKYEDQLGHCLLQVRVYRTQELLRGLVRLVRTYQQR